MTTVAIRNGIVAADSLATNNGWKVSDKVNKLFTLKNGSIGARIGDVGETENFIMWMKGGRKGLPPDLTDSRVVLMADKKRVIVYEGKGNFEIDLREEPFVAFGSGMAAALGAMHAGASAREAVEIACKVDTSTGGEVRWLRARR